MGGPKVRLLLTMTGQVVDEKRGRNSSLVNILSLVLLYHVVSRLLKVDTGLLTRELKSAEDFGEFNDKGQDNAEYDISDPRDPPFVASP